MKETDNQGNGLARRAALLAVANVAAFALAFLLPLVLVRTLDQTEFGLYKQAFQIIVTAISLLGLHVATSAYYFMPRYPDRKPQVAINILIFHSAVGAAVALLFALYPEWVTAIFKSDDLVPYIPLIGLAIFLWLVSSLLEVVAVADGRIRMASVLIVVVQLVKSLLLIGAGLIFGTIHAIVVAAVIQGAAQCVILFAYLYTRFGRFWASFDKPLLKAQLANALPFGFGALVFATQSDLNKYFVAHYFDPTGFAIYSVGCFQIPLLMVLVDSVSSVLIPEVARLELTGDYKSIIIVWTGVMRRLSLFFAPTCVFLYVCRYEFITTLFTTKYIDAVPVFTVNLIGVMLLVTVTGPVLRAFDEFKYFRLKLYLILIPVTSAALYFGIKAAGLFGAITADVSVQLLAIAITMTVIARKLRITLADLRYVAPILKTAISATAAGFLAFTIRLVMTEAHPIVTLAVCASAFGLVYLALAFITGTVTDGEKDELRRALLKSYRLGASWRKLLSATEAR